MTHENLNGNVKRKLELSPLYDCNQLPQSMSKGSWPNVQKRAQNKKTDIIDHDRPKRLSAAVAKVNMELWDTDSDNEKETDSSYGFSDFGSKSDSSDPAIY